MESPNKQVAGFFGFKLTINYDGSVVVVGADGEDESRGNVYIFQRVQNETEFHLCGHLKKDEDQREKEDNFGGSLSISDDANVIIVGAPGVAHKKFDFEDHGAIYVYERLDNKGCSWEMKKSIWLPHEYSTSNNLFAWAVVVNGLGTVVVGSSPDWNSSRGLIAMDTFERSPLGGRGVKAERVGKRDGRFLGWMRGLLGSEPSACADAKGEDGGVQHEEL